MSSRTLVNRFRKDTRGAALVEATLVMPLIVLLSIGTAELGIFLYQWNATSKATQIGARWAIVNAPLSSSLVADLAKTSWWPPEKLGASCREVACYPNGAYTCYAGANGCNLSPILLQMRRVFPNLNAEDVQVIYEPYPKEGALGFVGRPGGVPMAVTVGIRCRTYEFAFLSAWFKWAMPAAPNGCNSSPGILIPASETQLTSESFGTTSF